MQIDNGSAHEGDSDDDQSMMPPNIDIANDKSSVDDVESNQPDHSEDNEAESGPDEPGPDDASVTTDQPEHEDPVVEQPPHNVAQMVTDMSMDQRYRPRTHDRELRPHS